MIFIWWRRGFRRIYALKKYIHYKNICIKKTYTSKDNRSYWNNIYKDIDKTIIDTWLETYKHILDISKEKNIPIVDLDLRRKLFNV